MNLSELFQMSVPDFFAYVQTVAYGYRDTENRLHGVDEAFDPGTFPYAYSTPEEVVQNGVGWCWDVCQLIKEYFRKNDCPCKTYYFEYYNREKEQHQTHTQCFAHYDGQWTVCPDNSDPEPFGTRKNASLDRLIAEYQHDFFEFCAAVFGPLDPKCQLVKSFDLSFSSGMTDEALMQAIRDF